MSVIYEGPSQLDGMPIVCIATEDSQNHKTGPMVQTWILRSDVSPEEAIHAGQDASVCGTCPLRGKVVSQANGETVNRFRGCYVFVGQSPQAVWTYWRSQQRREVDCSGKMVRLGAYGDPCAVPREAWDKVLQVCAGWTGYTHQWRDERFQDYREFLMASVESVQDAAMAKSMGWRTFRVSAEGESPATGEFHCPASAEQGYRETCESCGACDGARNPSRASVIIWPHGPRAAVKSFNRIATGDFEPIVHRTSLTDFDSEVVAFLKTSGPQSASSLAARFNRGSQAMATRLWHLRQMGVVRRQSRGVYIAL